MPRFMIERDFPNGLAVPMTDEGRDLPERHAQGDTSVAAHSVRSRYADAPIRCA